MKMSFFFFTLIFLASSSHRQEFRKSQPAFLQDQYLSKSKKQRNTGFVLAGSGVVLFAAGTYALEHDTGKSGYGAVLIFGGIALAASGIPFFIASFGNKHKAKIYMNREAIMISPQRKSGLAYNSIVMKIDF